MSQTPPSLLNRLREAPGDADAWRRFDDICRPLLSGWLRRCSLQPHDASDLVQDILYAVAGEMPRRQGGRRLSRPGPDRGLPGPIAHPQALREAARDRTD